MKNRFDKKIFIIATSVFFLAAGLVWLAFFWQYGKIKEFSENIQKEHLDSFVKQERSDKIIELGKELDGIETREKEMRAMLVNRDNAVPFLELLEATAVETGNSIKIDVADLVKINSQISKKPAIQESDSETAEELQKESQAKKTIKTKEKVPDLSNQIGFSVELTGEYGSFIDFLTKLENVPYFVRVYSFQTIPSIKNQADQTSGSGVAAAGAAEGQSNSADAESKNTKSTIIIGAYTNGK